MLFYISVSDVKVKALHNKNTIIHHYKLKVVAFVLA